MSGDRRKLPFAGEEGCISVRWRRRLPGSGHLVRRKNDANIFFADASMTTRVLRENISAVTCDDCHHTQNRSTLIATQATSEYASNQSDCQLHE